MAGRKSGLQSASNAAKAASSISSRGANRKQAKAMDEMDLSKTPSLPKDTVMP